MMISARDVQVSGGGGLVFQGCFSFGSGLLASEKPLGFLEEVSYAFAPKSVCKAIMFRAACLPHLFICLSG